MRTILTGWLVFIVTAHLSGSLAADPSGAESAASVKAYLLAALEKVKAAATDGAAAASEYRGIIQDHGGDYSKAQAQDGARLEALVARMQADYQAMDSFGYETVEGIVAGVESLAPYDVYLDSGVPAEEGADSIAPVVLDLGDGTRIDREGSLFTFIIEPALWGGNPKWCVEVPAGGEPKRLPRGEVVVAAFQDAERKLGELIRDSRAWEASVKDCFDAMIVMTPTLSEYFEEWKESRYSTNKSGRFQAVSRVSDMHGIMSSCSVMYEAVKERVGAKERALGKSVEYGFQEIMAFLDVIERREQDGKIAASEIDELAEQAKEKTGKLVPQIEQGAALVAINTGG